MNKVTSQEKQTKKKRKENLTLKIVLMGNKYVGKTSILNRYVHGEFYSHYNFTSGKSFYIHYYYFTLLW